MTVSEDKDQAQKVQVTFPSPKSTYTRSTHTDCGAESRARGGQSVWPSAGGPAATQQRALREGGKLLGPECDRSRRRPSSPPDGALFTQEWLSFPALETVSGWLHLVGGEGASTQPFLSL